MGAAQTRKFFEKNLTKNFRAWVQCEHTAFMNKKADFRLRKSTKIIHYSSAKRFHHSLFIKLF